MARDLESVLNQAANDLHSTSPWIPLLEIDVGASSVAYLTYYQTSVTWDSKTYQPYPFEPPTFPNEKGQAQDTYNLKLWNIDQLVTDRARDAQLQGQEVRIYWVNSNNLSDTTNYLLQTATILGVTVARSGEAVLKLGRFNWTALNLGQRLHRLRCRFVYGSPQCGYDTGRTGALSTCERTFEDCVVHGDDEEDNGLFRLHPRNFGGAKGLPSQNVG